jgi:hypothetical protein
MELPAAGITSLFALTNQPGFMNKVNLFYFLLVLGLYKVRFINDPLLREVYRG